MSSKKLKTTEKGSGQKFQTRKRVTYSEAFKRQKVADIVAKRIKISELSRLYNVSTVAIYKWLYKYSPHHKQGTIQVVQMESEATKSKLLQERVKELEAALGRKQLEIDYYTELINKASTELGYDVKKNFAPLLSNGSETIKTYTTTD